MNPQDQECNTLPSKPQIPSHFVNCAKNVFDSKIIQFEALVVKKYVWCNFSLFELVGASFVF